MAETIGKAKTGSGAAGAATGKTRKGRSPAYPAMNLERALDGVTEILEEDDRAWTNISVTVQHLGYSSVNGAALRSVAALKAFGLLDEQGKSDKRELRVSDLAYRILTDDREDDTERRALIRQAALMPPIHKEMWEHWGASLPSDKTISYWLKHEKGYNIKAADDLCAEFIQTIDFAELVGETEGEEAKREEEEEPDPHPRRGTAEPEWRKMTDATALRDITIPLTRERDAHLSLPRPFTKDDLKALENYVKLLGQTLISEPDTADDKEPND